MTNNVHLDITHHSRDLYRQAKELRLHPWLGPSIYRCKILYDPQHFMDFTQASVRGQFNQPDNILARVRQRSERARQTWLSLRGGETNLDPENCRLYLQAVENVANAIASLSGSPLTERRFLLDFPQRARTVGHAGLHKGLLGLLGGPAVDADILRSWLPGWKAAFTTVSQADRRRAPPFPLPDFWRPASFAMHHGGSEIPDSDPSWTSSRPCRTETDKKDLASPTARSDER